MGRLVVFILLLILSHQSNAEDVVFCYEDKALPPMFTGNGLDVPEKDPGASIELLMAISNQLSDVNFVFIRRPWKRCLSDLKTNKVHAVIASYREEREAYMAFPKNKDGELDYQRAVSQFSSCLVGKKGRIEIARLASDISVAIPNGYSVLSKLSEDGYRVVSTYSQEEAYQLVLKGVVDSTIGICQSGKDDVNGFLYDDILTARYPPIYINYGFLVFSKTFAKSNESTVELIWNTLQTIPSTPLYLKYMQREVAN